MHSAAVRGHKVDATLRVLHNVLGAVNEDLAGIVDLQGEIGAQIKVDWQTTVAVDDTDTSDNTCVHGVLDVKRPASGRPGKGTGNGTEILAVFERLVGLLSGGW